MQWTTHRNYTHTPQTRMIKRRRRESATDICEYVTGNELAKHFACSCLQSGGGSSVRCATETTAELVLVRVTFQSDSECLAYVGLFRAVPPPMLVFVSASALAWVCIGGFPTGKPVKAAKNFSRRHVCCCFFALISEEIFKIFAVFYSSISSNVKIIMQNS